MGVATARRPGRAQRVRARAVRATLAALAAALAPMCALAGPTVGVGYDGLVSYAITVDSVRHQGDVTGYDLTSFDRVKASSGQTRRVVVDCKRQLRAVAPAPEPGRSAPASLQASRVRAGSREAGELATACGLPGGPRSRLFAGFVVAADGTVIAPHRRMPDCKNPVAYVDGRRQTATLVALADDLVILRIDGGPYPTLAPSARPVTDRQPVTMLGVDGVQPRVSAAVLRPARANPDDEGWPQVETLSNLVVGEGPVWDAEGGVVGFGVYKSADDRHRAMVRLLPAKVVSDSLAVHGIRWSESADARALDPEAAMRLAVGATLALACE